MLMHLLLLLLGIVLAAAGAAMVRYAVPVEDVAGAALFTSGMVAIVGALIVVSIAVAVRKLGRIAERLEIQPLPLPPIASVEREDPAPRQVKAPVAGARPSLLGWLGRASPSVAPRAARTAPPPAPEPAAPAAVDLTRLARLPEPIPPASVPPPPVRPQPKPAAAPNGTAAATVYRAGVIDGMAYTLFMDGSIQAELPTGTVKFSSVDDLQKYLLGNR
jgi:energy-converting hydrogenase Eha subunit C